MLKVGGQTQTNLIQPPLELSSSKRDQNKKIEFYMFRSFLVMADYKKMGSTSNFLHQKLEAKRVFFCVQPLIDPSSIKCENSMKGRTKKFTFGLSWSP